MPNDRTDKYLSRDDTKVMKCIAIILMLMHHLWFFQDRIPGGPLVSLFHGFHIPTLQILSAFGKICVPMFFFLGGYGIYKSSYGKPYDIFKRLKKLYFAYWKVFVIFIPIGFLFFSSQAAYCADSSIYTRFANFSIKELALNFFAIASTYNSEWWFLISYVFALCLYPVIRTIVDRNSAKSNVVIVFLVSLLLVHFFTKVNVSLGPNALDFKTLFFTFIFQTAPYIASFWMGAVTAKEGLLSKFGDDAKANKLLNPFTDIMIWGIVIYLRQVAIGETFDIFFVPMLTIASMDLLSRMKPLKKLLAIMGKQSTSMWLIHTFFCYYFGAIAVIVTAPRYAILSLLFLIALTYLASVLVSFFWSGVESLYNKIKKS